MVIALGLSANKRLKQGLNCGWDYPGVGLSTGEKKVLGEKIHLTTNFSWKRFVTYTDQITCKVSTSNFQRRSSHRHLVL